MKREIRQAIKRAIEESELNGYTWKITENGLLWSYCDVEFAFDDYSEREMLFLYDKYHNVSVCIWYGEDKYADCKTLTDAYYLATKKCIRQANHIY